MIDLRGLMALLLGGGYSACKEPLDQGMAKLVMVYQDEWRPTGPNVPFNGYFLIN